MLRYMQPIFSSALESSYSGFLEHRDAIFRAYKLSYTNMKHNQRPPRL